MNVNRSDEKRKKRQEADDIQQKTITDADYADDLTLPANTPA